MPTRRTVRLNDAGLTYDVSVERRDGRAHLVRFTVSGADDIDLIEADLLPLSVIASRALAAIEEKGEPGRKPSPEQLAAAYRDALAARNARRPGEATVSIRKELAARFGAPVTRVDEWLKAARAADPDLLPPAFTGRGFRSASTPEEPA